MTDKAEVFVVRLGNGNYLMRHGNGYEVTLHLADALMWFSADGKSKATIQAKKWGGKVITLREVSR